MKKKKNPGGRPAFDVESKLPLLERALLEGKSIQEAYEEAKIPRTIFYRWLAVNPEYRDTMNTIRGSVDDIADDALARQLEADPKDAEHRKEIASIAFRIREDRRKKQEQLVPVVTPGGPTVNVNIASNNITPEEANDLTDEELALVTNRKKTLAEILADRKSSSKK